MATKATEKDARSKKVADVVHSGRLEGREPTPAFEADAQKYVNGKLTADDVVKRTRKRYGLA